MPDRSPENYLAHGDLGDDTLERYRYQISYTAILWLSLLDESSEHEYLYCEHHEDVLLKRLDGCYCGVQIKTKEACREPFKSTDEAIVKSIRRFVELEREYSNKFLTYGLAASCGFWKEDKHGSNLENLIELAAIAVSDPLLPRPIILTKYLKKLNPDTGQDEITLKALSRIKLEKDMPHLKDVTTRLMSHLAEVGDLRQSDYVLLAETAKQIVSHIFQASSHGCEAKLKNYCAILKFPEETKAQVVIEGKKIDKNTLMALLAKSKATPILSPRTTAALVMMDRTWSKLQRKMTAGRLSVENVDHMTDLAHSSQTMFVEWLAKYGRQRTVEMYKHIELIVKNECLEVYDSHKSENIFGEVMLQEIRQRLRRRYEEEKPTLLGCRYEQFLGMVGILTDDGGLWWSAKFDMGEEQL